MELLYTDNRIVVCLKPAGVLSTDEPGGMPELLRRALGEDETGCVRVVHRLDRPVGGVMVYARSRMADSILSRQVQAHTFEKDYLAVLEGIPDAPEGVLADLLTRDAAKKQTFVTHTPGPDARSARLSYRVLGVKDGRALVRIRLETGRTHQIRAQFSSRSLPESVKMPMKLLTPSDRLEAMVCSGVTTALTMVAGMVAAPPVEAA